MNSIFDLIETKRAQNIPFVVYSKPNQKKLICCIQKDSKLHELKNYYQRGFIINSFLNDKKYIIPIEESEVLIEDVINYNETTSNNYFNEVDSLGKTKFQEIISKALDKIALKEFDKVVLSRKERVELINFNFIKSFKQILNTYPAAFRYMFYHPEIGFWIGASPEQLLKIKDKNIETVALAGTQLYAKNKKVKWSNKEIVEQQYVTDYVFNAISEISNSIKTSSPYTVIAGNLLHIKTDITATINSNLDVGKLINILHPTPAVCGFPKENALQFILENENYDRDFYSGFLGELNIDIQNNIINNSDLYVNLRCLNVEDTAVNLYIGCGITGGSNPEKEYIETVNKSYTMKKILN